MGLRFCPEGGGKLPQKPNKDREDREGREEREDQKRQKKSSFVCLRDGKCVICLGMPRVN